MKHTMEWCLVISLLGIVPISHAQWIQTSTDYFVTLAADGPTLYAMTIGDYYRVFRSTDGGTSWNATFTTLEIGPLVAAGGKVYLSCTYGLFLSSDSGKSWTQLSLPSGTNYASSLAASGSTVYACVDFGKVFQSTDCGTDWTEIDSGLPTGQFNCTIFDAGSSIFAAYYGTYPGYDGKVYVSTNRGKRWDSLATIGPIVSLCSISKMGDTVLACNEGVGGNYVFCYNDSSWNETGSFLSDESVSSIAENGGKVFVAASSGCLLSTNGGATWTNVSTGLEGEIYQIATRDSELIAITPNGVWRRPLSEMVAGVKGEGNRGPLRFDLEQNYPNPFNPTTIISYQVPSTNHVTLIIYDVLGRLVKSLVNEHQTAGTHSVVLDGRNLPSGVYFYRLEAGTYHDTKKLLLLK